MIRALLAVVLALSLNASAQSDDDAPIPYDSEENALPKETAKPKKKHKKKHIDVREEDEDEKAGEEMMTAVDDPNVGVGGEVLSGLALLDSAKAGVDPRYYFGLRFTWEFGRLIADEYLREMFFADVTWTYAVTKEGTNQVSVATHLHDFTIAPAFALPIGQSPVAFYAQLGAGFDYAQSISKIDANSVSLGGTKFLFQYGVGLRGRPAIVADGSVRLVFRVEVTRFIRGYLHDMYLGAGVGLIF